MYILNIRQENIALDAYNIHKVLHQSVKKIKAIAPDNKNMEQIDCQTKIKIDKLCKHEKNSIEKDTKTQNHGQQPQKKKEKRKRPTIIVKSTI